MHPRRRRRAARRLWTALVAALALPLSMLATGTTPAQAASVQCSVDYRTNDWGSGFTADLTLTNRGTDAINGWTLNFEFANGQSVYDLWGGTITQTGSIGQNASIRNASYNASIPAGATLDGRASGVGFNALADDFANAQPPNFFLNGRRCAVALP